MKRIALILLLGGMMGLFSGCDLDDDGYSLDHFWVSFGLVHTTGESEYFIKLDNDAEIYPAATAVPWFELSDSLRVLVNYTVLGNKQSTDDTEKYYVKINSLKKVLFKAIYEMTDADEDSIGNDPIHIKEIWQKDNMLNFELNYWGGNKIHYINLIRPQSEVPTDVEPFQLELRHNNREDTGGIALSAFVTFDLSSLQVDGKDSVTYVVHSVDFDGESCTYDGVYRYENN